MFFVLPLPDRTLSGGMMVQTPCHVEEEEVSVGPGKDKEGERRAGLRGAFGFALGRGRVRPVPLFTSSPCFFLLLPNCGVRRADRRVC